MRTQIFWNTNIWFESTLFTSKYDTHSIFHISHSINTKGHAVSDKTFSNFIQNVYFPNAPIWIKVLCNNCITCRLNKSYLHQKQILKGNILYFNHRISFDTEGPLSPSSEGNSLIIVIAYAFTHYVALNPVQHCNAYYAYTTLRCEICITRNPCHR